METTTYIYDICSKNKFLIFIYNLWIDKLQKTKDECHIVTPIS